MTDEFVSPEEFARSPRGRKTEWNEDLISTLKKVTLAKGAVLGSSIGEVAHEDRPAVSAMIRKHWRRDRTDDISISYSLTGVPQVEVKKSKSKR
jgi:hypothetical protein